jgi:hypothetical protein
VSNVVSLKRPPPKPKIPEGPRYWCTACDDDIFKLMGDGNVYCASCQMRMNNVSTRYENNPG